MMGCGKGVGEARNETLKNREEIVRNCGVSLLGHIYILHCEENVDVTSENEKGFFH